MQTPLHLFTRGGSLLNHPISRWTDLCVGQTNSKCGRGLNFHTCNSQQVCKIQYQCSHSDVFCVPRFTGSPCVTGDCDCPSNQTCNLEGPVANIDCVNILDTKYDGTESYPHTPQPTSSDTCSPLLSNTEGTDLENFQGRYVKISSASGLVNWLGAPWDLTEILFSKGLGVRNVQVEAFSSQYGGEGNANNSIDCYFEGKTPPSHYLDPLERSWYGDYEKDCRDNCCLERGEQWIIYQVFEDFDTITLYQEKPLYVIQKIHLATANNLTDLTNCSPENGQIYALNLQGSTVITRNTAGDPQCPSSKSYYCGTTETQIVLINTTKNYNKVNSFVILDV